MLVNVTITKKPSVNVACCSTSAVNIEGIVMQTSRPQVSAEVKNNIVQTAFITQFNSIEFNLILCNIGRLEFDEYPQVIGIVRFSMLQA